MYKTPDKPITADPNKYPQGRFNTKPCKWCLSEFQPKAPSHLFCCDLCKDDAHNDKYLRRVYGISLPEFEVMYENQEGLCAICGTKGFKMKDTNRTSLVVDHCHSSGDVRGLLCHNCNRALGLLKDDQSRLRNALSYLEGATTIPFGSRFKRTEAQSP